MHEDNHQAKTVIIHEISGDPTNPSSIKLTGRQLHVEEDFPIFAALEEDVRKQVLEAGTLALRDQEFTPFFNAVRMNNLLQEEQEKGTEPLVVTPRKKVVVQDSIPEDMKAMKGFKVFEGGKLLGNSDGPLVKVGGPEEITLAKQNG